VIGSGITIVRPPEPDREEPWVLLDEEPLEAVISVSHAHMMQHAGVNDPV
jgi:hypothetical protein